MGSKIYGVQIRRRARMLQVLALLGVLIPTVAMFSARGNLLHPSQLPSPHIISRSSGRSLRAFNATRAVNATVDMVNTTTNVVDVPKSAAVEKKPVPSDPQLSAIPGTVKTGSPPREKAPDPEVERPEHRFKGKSPLFFTCPDGRKGLHLVHVRLMLNLRADRGAKGTFRAARLLLFRDFSLASLARQTVQKFLLYVSYDFAQDFPFLEASLDIVKLRMTGGASYLYLPERAFAYTKMAHHQLAYPRIAELIAAQGLASAEELEGVQLYVTSRMDSDDAVSVESVELTQAEACEMVSAAPKSRLMISYMEPKLFWMPDANNPYGQLATVKTEGYTRKWIDKERRSMRYRPLMQSMAVDASLMRCALPLNVYSHKHFEPTWVRYLLNETDCPFEYDFHATIRLLRPKKWTYGALYSRSPGSWTGARADEIGYKFLPFDEEAILGCGVEPGELAATNLMLAMVYKEAPEAAKVDSDTVRGFGGIGYYASKRGWLELFAGSNETAAAGAVEGGGAEAGAEADVAAEAVSSEKEEQQQQQPEGGAQEPEEVVEVEEKEEEAAEKLPVQAAVVKETAAVGSPVNKTAVSATAASPPKAAAPLPKQTPVQTAAVVPHSQKSAALSATTTIVPKPKITAHPAAAAATTTVAKTWAVPLTKSPSPFPSPSPSPSPSPKQAKVQTTKSDATKSVATATATITTAQQRAAVASKPATTAKTISTPATAKTPQLSRTVIAKGSSGGGGRQSGSNKTQTA